MAKGKRQDMPPFNRRRLLAYMLKTSGSIGINKGAMIRKVLAHRAKANTFLGRYRLDEILYHISS